jgi:DNA-binding TFAR19-related protein (PDSD5 family)
MSTDFFELTKLSFARLLTLVDKLVRPELANNVEAVLMQRPHWR